MKLSGVLPALLAVFTASCLLAPGAARGQANAVGAEFQVNSYTTGYQGVPKACRAQSGAFAVVWRSDNQDGDSSGIFGQRYDSGGVAQGTEFLINSYTTGSQSFPAVTCENDGDFVVVWRSTGQDGSAGGIFGQRYDSAGASQGGEFQVNSYTTGNQDSPGIATDSGSNFLAVWTSTAQDGDLGGVFGQRFSTTGATIGTEFQINVTTTGEQATVLSSPAGCDDSFNCVVSWTSNGQDGNMTGVYGRRYASTGAPLSGEFQVNTYTTSRQENPAVAVDSDGDFVIVWRSLGQDGSNYGVFGQRFNATGAAQGAEFQVNTYTTGGQSFPAVAMNDGGDFVVAWASDAQDGNSMGVFGRLFDAGGTSMGGEFQVNSYTTGLQTLQSVAADASGNFVVAWQSGPGQDGSSFGVFAQRFELPLCRSTPRAGCRDGMALKPFILMKESFVDSRRKLAWKWLRGAETTLEALGDPLNTTAYALCLYDEIGGVPSLIADYIVPPDNTCGGEACWRATGTRGFKYKDNDGTQDGVRLIVLKRGENGKAKIILKSRGAALTLPPPVAMDQFLNQDTDVTVQFVNSLGECWTSEFPAPAFKNDGEQFRDK